MNRADDLTGALRRPLPGGPGLVWGIDFTGSEARDVEDCDSPHRGMLRWLHLNLAEHRTKLWIESTSELPSAAREVLLSSEPHQRALVEQDMVACVLHDFERDFDVRDTGQVGTLRLALTPALIVSARVHPIGSADIIKRRLGARSTVDGPAHALDLIVGSILENLGRVIGGLSAEVQAAEDALVENRYEPNPRRLLDVRRRLVQLHRMLSGLESVLHRLELDQDLPPEMLPVVEKLVQRVQGVDGDSLGVQSQLRLLREELSHQSDQRINQNLYLLSAITALLLPPTLVTGVMGMNTGGMLLAGEHGTLIAMMLSASAAAGTYLFLRSRGFFR